MVAEIRELCKKNKTTIAALERQLGFGNGVIGRWDKSTPSYERLRAVADALNVPVSALTGEEQEKPVPSGDNLTEEEAAILNWYRTKASESKKAIIKAIMEDE